MFANKMLYTKSPGGKRRGLIYQSSETNKETIKFEASNFHTIEPSGFMYEMSSLYTRIKITLSREDFCVENFRINSNWFPIYILPPRNIGFNDKVIDESTLSGFYNNNKILRKLQPVTISKDGHSFTQNMLVIYYDITNVPIVYDSSNNFRYYDIISDIDPQYSGSLYYDCYIYNTQPFKFYKQNNKFRYFGNSKYDPEKNITPSPLDALQNLSYNFVVNFDIDTSNQSTYYANNVTVDGVVSGGELLDTNGYNSILYFSPSDQSSSSYAGSLRPYLSMYFNHGTYNYDSTPSGIYMNVGTIINNAIYDSVSCDDFTWSEINQFAGIPNQLFNGITKLFFYYNCTNLPINSFSAKFNA